MKKKRLHLLGLLLAAAPTGLYAQTDVPWQSNLGPLGAPGSWMRFVSGSDITSIEELWGLNLLGDATHPVKVNNTSFMIGFTTSGQNYGNGSLFVAGNAAVGITSPNARLHVYEPVSLGTGLNNTTRLSIISGSVGSGNQFRQSLWLRRNTASGNDWYTASLHDGIDIDGFLATPGSSTRTWWERDPNNYIQSWGNNADTYMTLKADKLGIGTKNPDEKLTVNGTIHATSVKVTSAVPVPDYVFNKGYKLRPLSEVRRYLNANSHLPEIPSAKVIEQNGINLGEMNMQLLKKVEELTLYLIEKDIQLKNEHDQNQTQQKKLNQLARKVNKLGKIVYKK